MNAAEICSMKKFTVGDYITSPPIWVGYRKIIAINPTSIRVQDENGHERECNWLPQNAEKK